MPRAGGDARTSPSTKEGEFPPLFFQCGAALPLGEQNQGEISKRLTGTFDTACRKLSLAKPRLSSFGVDVNSQSSISSSSTFFGASTSSP